MELVGGQRTGATRTYCHGEIRARFPAGFTCRSSATVAAVRARFWWLLVESSPLVSKTPSLRELVTLAHLLEDE